MDSELDDGCGCVWTIIVCLVPLMAFLLTRGGDSGTSTTIGASANNAESIG